MSAAAAATFWSVFGVLLYTYVGYPLLMALLAAVRPRPVAKGDATPPVTVVIAAYNEEGAIAAKLDNTLALDYPADRLEVLVGSDASTDRTDGIVAGYAERRVRLLRVEGRKGKTAVQNACVAEAAGEIVVFTDATTVLAPDAVREMVRNFADPKVGCVGARLVYADRAGTRVGRGGTSYWGYETALKRLESRVNSLIGVSGCFYAIRKEVYEEIGGHLISDFVVVLNTVRKGYRAVFEERAVCEEETLRDPGDELAMRVRVALRTYNALRARRELLSPFRHGLFAVQLLSHKVLRYLVGPLLVVLLGANVLLAAQPFYGAVLALQGGFYLAAAAGHLGQRGGRRGGLLSVPYYFVLVNYAAMVALARFLRGDNITVWEPKR